MIIIPAIDIISGKVVRLTKGDYDQKTEYEDQPLLVAQAFEKAGLKRLHLVDLEGAKAQKPVNLAVLNSIATHTKLVVDFGGGVKSTEALASVFANGAQQVTAGSIAVKDKALVTQWIKAYGPKKIILGADVKDEQIAVHGWQERSEINLFDFLDEYCRLGVEEVICTDVGKDGMLQGPAFELYERIQKAFPQLKLIASGGVSGKKDLEELKSMGLYGAIVGKAYYEGRITLKELLDI